MADYQKYYARNENEDGQYGLKSYWTSSQTVEFNDGQTLENYKSALQTQIEEKGDSLDYDLDEGELYLYGNNSNISTTNMIIQTRPNVVLDDVNNFSFREDRGKARLMWTDPDDVYFADILLAKWSGTKIVRKIGSAPTSVNDGSIVFDSKGHNAYSSTPYFDEDVQNGNYYYYRLFPYDTEGNYYGRTCGIVYIPLQGAKTWASLASKTWQQLKNQIWGTI